MIIVVKCLMVNDLMEFNYILQATEFLIKRWTQWIKSDLIMIFASDLILERSDLLKQFLTL